MRDRGIHTEKKTEEEKSCDEYRRKQTRFLGSKGMKRVLAVVACGSLHMAPCQASSGWGAAGSTAGAGSTWPSLPPDGPPQGPSADEQSNNRPPLDPANYYHTDVPPPGGEGFGAIAAPNEGAAGYEESHAYHQHSQQQQQQYQHQHQHHQQQHQPPPPYERSYIPQQSRWAGQHRHQQQQQRFPQHEGYPPPPGGTGQPLHLGTKWRNMVSRVKDAVRPGQPPSADYGGYQATSYDSGGNGDGGGGRAEGGGGGGGYSPPGSSWVGGANQNEWYNPSQGVHGGKMQPSANTGYGGDYEQKQHGVGAHPAPAAAGAAVEYGGGYPPAGGDSAAAPFDDQEQRHHAPPPRSYFDSADSSAQSPGAPLQAQAPGLYGEGSVDGSRSGHRHTMGSTEGYGGSVSGDYNAGAAGTTMSEGQRVAVGGGLPAREPSFGPQQAAVAAAAAPSAMGEGWSTPGAGPTPVVAPQSPAATDGDTGLGNGATMAPAPNDSAWTAPAGQSGGVEDGGPNTAGSRPPGGADAATPFESRVEPSEPAAATGRRTVGLALRIMKRTSLM